MPAYQEALRIGSAEFLSTLSLVLWRGGLLAGHTHAGALSCSVASPHT